MICPNCQVNAAITEQHYGALYTCNSCRAVYFINFEGQPEFGDVTEEVVEEAVEQVIEAPAVDTPMDRPVDMPVETTLDNAAENFIENPAEAPLEASNEAGFEAALEPLIDSVDVVNFENNFDLPKVETPIDDFSNNSFADAAKEISDFGNTEAQIASLSYDLKISGIDTQETKRLFLEAIEDSKFGWDANEIMRSIKNGQVEFLKLNPVKAFILAKRLQFLDMEKQWKQNATS